MIFISHRLNEVKECAERVVVLRDGRVTGHLSHEISHEAMIRLMIGRDLKSLYTPPAATISGDLLSWGLRTPAFPERTVDLTLRRGEILGLAGLIGAGRTELARAVFGVDQAGPAASAATGGRSRSTSRATQSQRHLPRARRTASNPA